MKCQDETETCTWKYDTDSSLKTILLKDDHKILKEDFYIKSFWSYKREPRL